MQVFETRRENTHAIPPPADAPIVVKDHGSCGPRYLRSLLNMVPQVGWQAGWVGERTWVVVMVAA